ncbi:MAG: hypothetical protein KJO49_07765 [Bacteroidia bacterium]|nr:hypothetical protein [Bacteroidia bacterium]NNF81307.1 hypothetical protein [Flavobacteriaceae bacterium]NNL79892.1 hypothetical protein [Flavobacteriaceae bacterium]
MKENFKTRWQITKNWQLIYPIVGILGLAYSSFKLSELFRQENLYLNILFSVVIFFVLLKITLKLFDILETRWKVKQRWHVIRIFIVFAITGSMSLIVTRPIFELIGFVKPNFDMNGWTLVLYYVAKFLLIMPFYTLLLVFFGWVLREYDFFLKFAIKMANRFGLKKFTRQFDTD